jgi:hypothetical protein
MLDSADFQRRLKTALGSMKHNAATGVRLACAHVKLEAQKRVPVDEGNLKGSAYTNIQKGPRGLVGEIGFTAKYAAAVHEKEIVNRGVKRKDRKIRGVKVKGKGKYWDPSTSTNKFLEKAFDENRSEIIQIIHKSAKL